MNTAGAIAHPGVHCFTPPGWPTNVSIACTSRRGGVSGEPYASFNLGVHVGDDPAAVAENRRRLGAALPPQCAPFWLRQEHGARVVRADPGAEGEDSPPTADASWTPAPGVACAVMTADCLPVLLTDEGGSRVAAVHAGWRGLAAGVIEATVAAMAVPAPSLLAWLGPAIGPAAFEVGPEVREQFLEAADRRDREATGQCFHEAARAAHYRADLWSLARLRLATLGVARIEVDARCTFSDAGEFFSFRRDGQTGRMAFLIFQHDP